MEDTQSGTTKIQEKTVNPVDEHIEKFVEKYFFRLKARLEIEERLRELRIDAVLGGERFSESSEQDLRDLLGSLALTRRPSIFLLDNGNLRALWRNDAKEQVGLQFLGAGAVQFVMFKLRKDPPMMARDWGVDVLSAIKPRITVNGCDHIVSE
jgi:hypothetical protein